MKSNWTFSKLCLKALLLSSIFLNASCASYLQRREFEQKRRQWTSQNIVNYRYTIKKMTAFADSGKAVLIEVRDGKQVSLKCIECEIEAPDAFKRLDSMEKIFDIIDQGIGNEFYSLEVIYDETFGYPIYWKGEMKTPPTDVQWKNEISNFEVIE